MTDKLIIKNMQLLPEQLKREALDFILFLQNRSAKTQNAPHAKRKFGSHKGKYKLARDFDAPLEDFKEYM